MGHLELADTYERALWVPLSDQHLHYDGVTNATLVLCSIGESHEGMYCCRVSSDSGDSILSEAAHVEMIKPDGKQWLNRTERFEVLLLVMEGAIMTMYLIWPSVLV